MKYRIQNGLGKSIESPSSEQMKKFLFDVDANDVEHGAAWMTTSDAETTLEWNGDGRLVLWVGEGDPRHLSSISRERALELWLVLASGGVAEIERQPWIAGNGYVRSAAEEAQLVEGARRIDREFYDSLGTERGDAQCRKHGCKRGAVSLSVFCRVHHFESVCKRPSPFNDWRPFLV